jgi:AbrB family looped-hinge helix DNA binding protein
VVLDSACGRPRCLSHRPYLLESTGSLFVLSLLAVIFAAFFAALFATHSVLLDFVTAVFATLLVTLSFRAGTPRQSEQAERTELGEPPSGQSDTTGRSTGTNLVGGADTCEPSRSPKRPAIRTLTHIPTVCGNMTKVDSKGRIVLPKDVRESLGIDPGTEVQIHEENGKAVVEPEDDPEQVLERLDQLVAEIPENRDPTPYDELDPQSKDHVDTIRQQAERSESDASDE